jgi:hypothetical protein
LRFVVTANNFNIFASDPHALTTGDRDAIASRFFEVHPSPDAASLMMSIPIAERDALAAQDIIAKHALHLAATREVVSDSRFIVEGDKDGAFATRIITEDHRYGTWTVEWLARYLSEPTIVESNQGGLVWRGAGKVLVSPEAVINTFEKVLRNKQRPQSLEISNALRSLSTGQLVPFPDGKGTGFDVLVDVVAAWAKEKGVGSPSAIIAASKQPRVVRGEAGATNPRFQGIKNAQ